MKKLAALPLKYAEKEALTIKKKMATTNWLLKKEMFPSAVFTL